MAKWNLSLIRTILLFFLNFIRRSVHLSSWRGKGYLFGKKFLEYFSLSLSNSSSDGCIFHSISTARRRQSVPEITLTLDLKPRRDDNPLTRSVRTVCRPAISRRSMHARFCVRVSVTTRVEQSAGDRSALNYPPSITRIIVSQIMIPNFGKIGRV